MSDLLAWLRRHQPRRREPTLVNASLGPSLIPAAVTGIYGTVHTSEGDVDTDSPYRVEVDCELITFYLPIDPVPFDATFDKHTLHFGILSVTTSISRTQRIRKGDRLTVVQSVTMLGLSHTPGELPEWART